MPEENTQEQDVIAREITVEGVVTGVGFRFFVREVVMRIGDIKGYVRNVTRGQVECFFQGPRKNVEQAIQQVRRGPPGARVDRCNVRETSVNNKYDRFSIVP